MKYDNTILIRWTMCGILWNIYIFSLRMWLYTKKNIVFNCYLNNVRRSSIFYGKMKNINLHFKCHETKKTNLNYNNYLFNHPSSHPPTPFTNMFLTFKFFFKKVNTHLRKVHNTFEYISTQYFSFINKYIFCYAKLESLISKSCFLSFYKKNYKQIITKVEPMCCLGSWDYEEIMSFVQVSCAHALVIHSLNAWKNTWANPFWLLNCCMF